MATVRFKFRSAATFDSVEIGEQSSISIRDLKSKIVLKKHLNLCQDFDLVFSDSVSGKEYTDENIRIPSGSNVIIKRVPAKSSPSLRVSEMFPWHFLSVSEFPNHETLGPRGFVLHRASDTSAGCFGVRDAECVDVFDHPAMIENEEAICSQELLVRCQKLEAAHPVHSTLKDSSANEGSTLVMPKPKFEEQMQPERTSPEKHLAMENSDMPSELKCSLCRTFFKEAVMIPCCQHSFCGRCISVALSQNAKCPMCLSSKCKPEDLLPNVSLRQAIQRFLDSQLLRNGSENDLQRYAPDGESGIQVKDLSSATWNRSNQIMRSKLHDDAHLADKCTPGTLEDLSEFQGENEPQNLVHGTQDDGGERNFTAPGRPNKGPRTCYMCGSPDHLIRDCPGAAHWNVANSFCDPGVASLPGTVPGYPPPYWPGSPPHSRPFINMYGGPGMMFYNATTAPISPFAFPSYAPSMYGGYPASECMNSGGMIPPVGNIAQQPRHGEHEELQGFAKQQRNCDVDLDRDRNDRDHNVNTNGDFMDRGPYHSGDGFSRRSEGKHRSHDRSDGDNTYLNCNRQGKAAGNLECGRELRIAQSDRSSSEADVLDSRIRPREDRHEKHHRTFRRNDEIGAPYGRDSKQKHYQPKKESSKRKRMEYDERKSDRHSHSRSRSSLERSYSGGEARQRREGSTHRSRHSNRSAKYNGKEMHHERGKIKYPNDYGEDYHNKRKHFH
ncbi:E3 ubiquitin-protein ligase RBBP6 [Bienertia sinuspersici]